MERDHPHESRFLDSEFDARLRRDAEHLQRATSPAFAARVMRDLPPRTAAPELLPMVLRPSSASPRFARVLLAAAVVMLALLSGLYIGAPWRAPTGDSVSAIPGADTAPRSADPGFIPKPRITFDFDLQQTLRAETTQLVARANTLRASLLNRLPLRGQAAPDTNDG